MISGVEACCSGKLCPCLLTHEACFTLAAIMILETCNHLNFDVGWHDDSRICSMSWRSLHNGECSTNYTNNEGILAQNARQHSIALSSACLPCRAPKLFMLKATSDRPLKEPIAWQQQPALRSSDIFS